jgi:hypothetical protein
MSNPQQPELRRSGEAASLNPDAIEGNLGAARRPTAKGNTGPVPPGNRSGATNGGDPDKPDLSKFAAKLGIDEPDPDGERAAEAAHESVEHASDGLVGTAANMLRTTSKVALGAIGLGVGAAAWAVPKVVQRVRRMV